MIKIVLGTSVSFVKLSSLLCRNLEQRFANGRNSPKTNNGLTLKHTRNRDYENAANTENYGHEVKSAS